jgi:hypothetical protein
VCPSPTVIDSTEIKAELLGATAEEIVTRWVRELAAIEDRCVRIDRHTPQLFDIWYATSSRLSEDLAY